MRLLRGATLQFALDLLLVGGAWLAAYWLRFSFLDIPDAYEDAAWRASAFALVAYAFGLLATGTIRQVWRFTSLPELRQLAAAVGLGGVLTAAAVLMLRQPNFPRSVLLLHPIVALLLMSMARAAWRTFAERGVVGAGRRVVIVGSLEDAADALRALRGSQQWHAVGILSPLPGEVGRSLQDVRVLGRPEAMARVCADLDAQTALVAATPGSPERRSALLHAAAGGIALLTLPRPDEWLRAGATPGPRAIELEDLLGRAPVQLDVAALTELFTGHTVLITGAGGSIGSELCRQVARFGAAHLVCVDISEFAIYQLEQELRRAHPQMQVSYYTANVREFERLRAIALRHRPVAVLHAAAYKHVPLMEEHNEIEAVRTNVLGTWNAARVAGECGAQRFVFVSTDKAVNPTNVMGASKRLAEQVVQGVAAAFPQTGYLSVRFGNVLGSSGSVVPLFTGQIARGGPVTVTHPDIVRYFMTIAEAVQLVLQAGLMGRSGQIFVLDMGEQVPIVELARMMIRLSGKTEDEVPIVFTGLRPGEKLFEELLASDETSEPTPHPKLRVAKASGGQRVDGAAVARWVEEAGAAPAGAALRDWLRLQVPEYQPR